MAAKLAMDSVDKRRLGKGRGLEEPGTFPSSEEHGGWRKGGDRPSHTAGLGRARI